MQFNVRGFVALVSEEELIEIELNTFLRCYKMSIEVELDSVEKTSEERRLASHTKRTDSKAWRQTLGRLEAEGLGSLTCTLRRAQELAISMFVGLSRALTGTIDAS